MARRASHAHTAFATHDPSRPYAPSTHLLGLALEAKDRQATLAAPACPKVSLAKPTLDPARAGQGKRHACLPQIGEPGHVGSAMALGELPKSLHAGLEVLEEDAFVDALLRSAAHTQRKLVDHPEHALRADRQFAHRRPRCTRRKSPQVELACRGHHAQTEDHALETAVAGRSLAGRTRGGATAERHVLKGLREVAQCEAARTKPSLGLARSRA